MKKTLLFASVLLTSVSFAQFTNADFPTIGTSVNMYVVDTFVTDYANVTGTGVTWDYSTAAGINTAAKTVSVVDPTTVDTQGNFPNADIAVIIPGFITNYLKSTTSALNSEGFTFTEATFGDVTCKFDTDNELMMNYPYAQGNSLIDAISGTAVASLGSFPLGGSVNTTVDGMGTLKLNAATTLNNVMRYRIEDSISANAGFLGTVIMKRVQYEYYDLASSKLPVFIHANLNVTLQGSVQTTAIVMSAYQPDETLNAASAELTGVSVYPNPTKDVINVSGLDAEATVELVDLSGKSVLKTTANGTQAIALNGIQNGTYIVKISSEKGTMTSKVTVQ